MVYIFCEEESLQIMFTTGKHHKYYATPSEGGKTGSNGILNDTLACLYCALFFYSSQILTFYNRKPLILQRLLQE